MSEGFTFYVDENDLRKIERIFTGFNQIEKEAVIKDALSQGMSRIVAVGKTALKRSIIHKKKSTGNLARSMTSSVNVKGTAKGTAGFKRSTRFKRVGGGNHSYLVDRGTAERWQRSTGKYTGSVRRGSPNTGSNFWTNTVESEGPKVLDNLTESINNAIIKIIDRQ